MTDEDLRHMQDDLHTVRDLLFMVLLAPFAIVLMVFKAVICVLLLIGAFIVAATLDVAAFFVDLFKGKK